MEYWCMACSLYFVEIKYRVIHSSYQSPCKRIICQAEDVGHFGRINYVDRMAGNVWPSSSRVTLTITIAVAQRITAAAAKSVWINYLFVTAIKMLNLVNVALPLNLPHVNMKLCIKMETRTYVELFRIIARLRVCCRKRWWKSHFFCTISNSICFINSGNHKTIESRKLKVTFKQTLLLLDFLISYLFIDNFTSSVFSSTGQLELVRVMVIILSPKLVV